MFERMGVMIPSNDFQSLNFPYGKKPLATNIILLMRYTTVKVKNIQMCLLQKTLFIIKYSLKRARKGTE